MSFKEQEMCVHAHMGACVLGKLKWVGNEEEENSHWGLLQ